MDRSPDRPLSTEEAKRCLRSVTQDTLPSRYVREHPYTWLALAFGAGMLLGGTSATRGLVTRTLLRLL